MTWIRIDPNEMETGSRELQSCSTTVGDTVAGLQAQCAGCGMPATVAGQVATTLATIERQLHDVRIELLLEATILALRGILAVKGSAVAGTLFTGEVAAPTAGDGFSGLTGGWMNDMATIGGNATPGFTITPGDGFTGLTGGWMNDMATIGGHTTPDFVITNPDGSLADPNLFAGLNTISAPTSPGIAALPAPLFNLLNDSNAHMNDVWSNPSRSSLMTDWGRYVSPSEYDQRGYRGLN